MEKSYKCKACRWFDRGNGNTYHSVNVTRFLDNKTIVHPMTYGYGDHFRQTALETMYKAGWLPKEYNKDNWYQFERDNDYPIIWEVSDGLKRDMVANGKL